MVLICIFLKSCTTNEKACTTKEKAAHRYIFGTLSLALNFVHDAVCTKMYIFFQPCTNSVVVISIFLKSCTPIKKLYNQRKKLYIFGTLSLALNFNDNECLNQNVQFFPKLCKFCGPHMYISKRL